MIYSKEKTVFRPHVAYYVVGIVSMIGLASFLHTVPRDDSKSKSNEPERAVIDSFKDQLGKERRAAIVYYNSGREASVFYETIPHGRGFLDLRTSQDSLLELNGLSVGSNLVYELSLDSTKYTLREEFKNLILTGVGKTSGGIGDFGEDVFLYEHDRHYDVLFRNPNKPSEYLSVEKMKKVDPKVDYKRKARKIIDELKFDIF